MSDGAPESHGVHGAPREDGEMQEEPTGAGGVEGESSPEKTVSDATAT